MDTKARGVQGFRLRRGKYHLTDPAYTVETNGDLAVRLKYAAACGDTTRFGFDLLVGDSILLEALWMAADNGQLGVVNILVKRVSNVNAQVGEEGTTALQAAARNGHRAGVEALMGAGATDKGGVAAKLAEDSGHGKLASVSSYPIGQYQSAISAPHLYFCTVILAVGTLTKWAANRGEQCVRGARVRTVRVGGETVFYLGRAL